MSTSWDDIFNRVVEALGEMPGITSISLGGSAYLGLTDDASDLDFHVYLTDPFPSDEERANRLAAFADAGSLRTGLTSWGLEDHLSIDERSIELIYRRWKDISGAVETAYDTGLPGQGFTTAVLYSVAHCHVVYDPTGALRTAKDRLNSEFPGATYERVLRRTLPLLRFNVGQLHLAQKRDDLLHVNRLRSVLQELYFDALFILNEMYHPGQKRLLEHSERCPVRPSDCEGRWKRVAVATAESPALATELEALVEELYDLVRENSDVSIPEKPL